MSVTPHAEGPNYDVRAPFTVTNTSKAGDQYVSRGHCLHSGCHWLWEGEDADRQARLHTEKVKHPTACRAELLGVHQRH